MSRLEELPPAEQRAVRAALGGKQKVLGSRVGRREARGGGQWRCATCGAVSVTYAAAERHADELGHHRVECVLP